MDLKHFFEQGIAHDLMMAQRHFFVYRTIGEHAHLINQAKKSNERSTVNYIQGLAMEQAIMSLSKVYDRKSRNGKFKVRSLETLFDQDFTKYGQFPYPLEHFESFKSLQLLLAYQFPEKEITTSEAFLNFLKYIPNSMAIKPKLENLRVVRNKYIAHNEHLETIPEIAEFWQEMVFLMDLAKLILVSIGEVYFSTEYFQYKDIGFDKVNYTILFEFDWLIALIHKIIGKENFVKWWSE